MKLILVRHGETDWNKSQRVQGRSDIELNNNGIQEAKLLGLSLKDEKIDAFYASPLKRAITTAAIVASYHHGTVITDERLCELDQGKFEGMKYSELREHYRDFLMDWGKKPSEMTMPNGESLIQLQERAWDFVTEMQSKHNDKCILVVGHNFTNIVIICKALDTELSQFRSVRQDRTAKTIILFENSGATVTCLNDISHLEI